MRKSTINLAALAVAGLAALVSGPVLAGGSSSNYVHTKGGLSVSDPSEDYWFRLGGTMAFDSVSYHGNTAQRQLTPDGANLRRAEIGLSGGVGHHWVYKLSTDFGYVGDGITHAVTVKDAYVGFAGVKNAFFSVGQISAPLTMQDAMSSGDFTFMERSLMATAVSSGYGLGVYGDTQYSNLSLSGAIFTPEMNVIQDLGGASHYGDPLGASARLTYAPVHTAKEVWHFGVSGLVQRLQAGNGGNGALEFGSAPELYNRNSANSVIGSGVDELSPGFTQRTQRVSTGTLTGAHRYEVLNLETAGQWGPILAAADYQYLKVNRAAVYNGDMEYKGYSVMGAYMLTGESRSYDKRTGSFGGIKPVAKHGAWELAARYSLADLRDQDTTGAFVTGAGAENNVTVGANWYVNNHVRFMANYVNAVRTKTTTSQDVKALGLRAQVTW